MLKEQLVYVKMIKQIGAKNPEEILQTVIDAVDFGGRSIHTPNFAEIYADFPLEESGRMLLGGWKIVTVFNIEVGESDEL